ncbi:glycosyltransferase [Agrilactobacillus composti DSM 18527 = JCM 14202]|uniref:Glycosyltransferase n=1 Tax=Agrilactobacillus composti DSM 18527 = JCM 14202 TaxID=1423734 RepID=X0QR14_9LACO|nr:glycosyltransferase [Agrilactobacillus composti DSM 18527 = JCM 14202]GAF41045.1 glycosyltransferase [Agrilactobacillus composti DSM 18527 = JCM 14202]
MNKLANLKVTAVIVTFNKIELFKECLAAIRAQTTPVSHIVVVDNHSSDDTPNYLAAQSDIINYRTAKNLGGAGGFNTGMKQFMTQTQDDLVWIMDDDTIPEPTALEELLAGANIAPDFGFLCSNVKWTDNNPTLMNIPNVDRTGWNDIAEKGLIKVESASFVSVMIPRTVVAQIGYPITDFFIWGDDLEYTLRITTTVLHKAAYFVPDSICIHKMGSNGRVDILTEKDPNRLNRFYYNYRNLYYISKKQGGRYFARHILASIYTLLRVPFKSPNKRAKRMGLILKGLFAGIVFHPNVEFPKD